MAMIKVENLTFYYPGSYDNVFLNTSFQIDTNWILGCVGRNGRGKTTFLKLLMGEFFYSGKISSPVKFDYFPFEVSDSRQNVLDVLHRVAPLAMVMKPAIMGWLLSTVASMRSIASSKKIFESEVMVSAKLPEVAPMVSMREHAGSKTLASARACAKLQGLVGLAIA